MHFAPIFRRLFFAEFLRRYPQKKNLKNCWEKRPSIYIFPWQKKKKPHKKTTKKKSIPEKPKKNRLKLGFFLGDFPNFTQFSVNFRRISVNFSLNFGFVWIPSDFFFFFFFFFLLFHPKKKKKKKKPKTVKKKKTKKRPFSADFRSFPVIFRVISGQFFRIFPIFRSISGHFR
jgi:hypothetical protein